MRFLWIKKRQITYTGLAKKVNYFANTKGILKNKYEGQIDTGLMMKNLILLAQLKGAIILNSIGVTALNDLGNKVEILSNVGVFQPFIY